MSDEASILTIEQIDHSNEGVIVHFSNGESVLYHAAFLYEVRNDDGNKPLSAGTEDDE